MSRYRTGVERDDLVLRIAQLEQRIRNLESGNRAGFTAVDDGAFVVKDANGNTLVELGKTTDGLYGLRVNNQQGTAQIKAGELAVGTYGLQSVNPNTQSLVDLGNFVFGINASIVPANETTTSLSYTDLDTQGPELDVTVGNTGKLLVISATSFDYNMSNSQDGGFMSYRLDGPDVVSPNDSWAVYSHLQMQASSGTASGIVGKRMAQFYLHEELTPGNYLVKAKYKAFGTGTPTCGFLNRAILVIPL